MKEKRQYYAHLTLKSDNAKTGPIPVSVTTRDACPLDCAFRGNGCYAEGGPIGIHWKKVTDGERGMGWDMFCDAVATLPPMQLWRHNAAGDLPGDGVNIDRDALEKLLDANFGKRGFTYTHYRPDSKHNIDAIAWANVRGLTVNLSANNLEEADRFAALDIGPVVVVLPYDAHENVKTPHGRTVVVCPATQREDISCATCQLCQRQRDTIVGFPAHGYAFKKVTLIAKGDRIPEVQNP
jgi:hypothetical protein